MTVTVTARSDTYLLLARLAAEQERIRGIVAGLDDTALRQPVLPSGWSFAGMLQHLTAGVRFWLVEVMSGQPIQESEHDDFHVDDGVAGSALVSGYEEQARVAAGLVRDLPLDAPPAWWPEGAWGGWRLHTFHEVLLHLLVETSCHAGHLDAARELLDGRTWDYAQGRLADPN